MIKMDGDRAHEKHGNGGYHGDAPTLALTCQSTSALKAIRLRGQTRTATANKSDAHTNTAAHGRLWCQRPAET